MGVDSFTQKDGVQCPPIRNRGIHDNSYVQIVFMRFPAHRSVEERTEDLPCALWTWRMEKMFLQSCWYWYFIQLYSCLETPTLSLEKQAGVYKSLLKSNHDWVTTQFAIVDVASV